MSDRGLPEESEDRSETPDRATAEFDWRENRPPSVVVIETIADLTDRNPESFDPLYEYVDVDALDSLFVPREDGQDRGSGRVSFHAEGFHVSVHSDGLVAVERDDGSRE